MDGQPRIKTFVYAMTSRQHQEHHCAGASRPRASVLAPVEEQDRIFFASRYWAFEMMLECGVNLHAYYAVASSTQTNVRRPLEMTAPQFFMSTSSRPYVYCGHLLACFQAAQGRCKDSMHLSAWLTAFSDYYHLRINPLYQSLFKIIKQTRR